MKQDDREARFSRYLGTRLVVLYVLSVWIFHFPIQDPNVWQDKTAPAAVWVWVGSLVMGVIGAFIGSVIFGLRFLNAEDKDKEPELSTELLWLVLLVGGVYFLAHHDFEPPKTLTTCVKSHEEMGQEQQCTQGGQGGIGVGGGMNCTFVAAVHTVCDQHETHDNPLWTKWKVREDLRQALEKAK